MITNGMFVTSADQPLEPFNHIVDLIESAKQNALRKVNEELIMLYFNIGKYLSKQLKDAGYGDAFIDSIADYIKTNRPDIKGFNRRGLYRMKQFYEAYEGDEIVSAVLTQLSWTNHLTILSAAKSGEERQFYIALCIKEKYSSRELTRQIESAYFERYMLSKTSPAPITLQSGVKDRFLDSYVLDFLQLPETYSESDLQKGILQNLKKFILELGGGFSFVGEEYRVQIGDSDFYIDLLFYHRELACLVAFELKINKFEPEYLGKMNFYLEALDREHRKTNENPSVGVILCKSKNDEVVEFALSRSLSPTLVAEYQTKLIDKELLQDKLHELFEHTKEAKDDDDEG